MKPEYPPGGHLITRHRPLLLSQRLTAGMPFKPMDAERAKLLGAIPRDLLDAAIFRGRKSAEKYAQDVAAAAAWVTEHWPEVLPEVFKRRNSNPQPPA